MVGDPNCRLTASVLAIGRTIGERSLEESIITREEAILSIIGTNDPDVGVTRLGRDHSLGHGRTKTAT